MEYITLMSKQKEILHQIKKGKILNLGTGTGKTLIALFWYFLNHNDKELYIIAPSAKVKEAGWDREIKNVAFTFGLDIPKYRVVSYSMVHKTKFGIGVYILDEAHYIKNPMAIRSKSIKGLITYYALDWIMLTASAGSKPEDYAHYFMLWGYNNNKTNFYKEYIELDRVRMGFNNFLKVVGYKNQEKFKLIVKHNTTDKLTVDDLVEMPDISEKYIEFKASNDYRTLKKTRILKKDNNIIPLDTIIMLYTTLRQHVSTKDKLEYLKYLVEQVKEQNDNILIFYNFKSELDAIKKALSEINYIVNGDTKIYPKKEEFKSQKGTITLVQIQAGGTGIELTYCNRIVYYSPTYSYQDYEQSLGRSYRIGQDKKIIIYKFKTINTIEEAVWNALEQKQDFVEKFYKGD